MQNAQTAFRTGPWTALENAAAHRLHRPSSLMLIKTRTKPESGKSDVAEMAPLSGENEWAPYGRY
jgi:hypothetical protein